MGKRAYTIQDGCHCWQPKWDRMGRKDKNLYDNNIEFKLNCKHANEDTVHSAQSEKKTLRCDCKKSLNTFIRKLSFIKIHSSKGVLIFFVPFSSFTPFSVLYSESVRREHEKSETFLWSLIIIFIWVENEGISKFLSNTYN